MLCGICLETLEEFYPYTLEERYYAISDYNKSFVDNKIEMYKKTYLQIENIYRKEMQERLLKEKEPQNV
jgi:predicted nucleotide-binding protein (sugar kinase/HSP70/actin superfamily)